MKLLLTYSHCSLIFLSVIQGTPVSVKSFEDDEDYVVMTKEQEDEGNESDSTQSIEDYHCPKQLLEVDNPVSGLLIVVGTFSF